MKLSIKTIAVLFTAAAMCSCNDGDKAHSSTDSSSSTMSNNSSNSNASNMDSNTTAMSTPTGSNAEQDFINFVVPANMKEMAFLKEGISKGSKDIKSHAQMMLKDHEKMGADVKNYLSKHPNLTMPTDTAGTSGLPTQAGSDFDKAWKDKSVADHKDLLDHLNQAKTSVTDADLSKIVTGAIPVVQSHLDMSNMIQKNQ